MGAATQVAIVGAGPAGLVLSHYLARRGVESVVLEQRDREFVEQRLRAGLLEPGTVERLERLGVAERLRTEGATHGTIKLRFDGRTYPLEVEKVTGKEMTGYPQQEIVKDLIAARLEEGGEILFEASAVALEGLEGSRPTVRYRRDGVEETLECDFVAGCDGFHGPSRAAIPADQITTYSQEFDFGWLGILAEAPPSDPTGVYCYHERGFALLSLRGPRRSRHYLQVDITDDLEEWPEERIWGELALRAHASDPDWTLNRGPIIDSSITPMRGFVAEPMRYHRLFLAGDSAHIVPPTGAKGLNLAVADAWTLGEALAAWYANSDEGLLDGYSNTCLRRAWRRVEFSIAMTELMHVIASEGPETRHRLQLSRLDYLISSAAATASLAENYVGYDYQPVMGP